MKKWEIEKKKKQDKKAIQVISGKSNHSKKQCCSMVLFVLIFAYFQI